MDMQLTAMSVLPHRLRNWLLLGVGIALALVIGGRLLAPGMSVGSTMAGVGILLAYGVLAVFAPVRLHQRHPEILRTAVVFGLLAGAVFAGEIVLEYVLLPTDNTRYGIVEFGAVLSLYFASGLVSAVISVRRCTRTVAVK